MPKKPEPITPKPKGAMGRVAEALSNPATKNSFKTVEGYDKLPSSVRQTLETMQSPELEALGRLHNSLVEGDLFEDVEDKHGVGRVSFF